MNQSNCYLLEKLANQSILNDAFMIKMIHNYFYESKSRETSKEKEAYGW